MDIVASILRIKDEEGFGFLTEGVVAFRPECFTRYGRSQNRWAKRKPRMPRTNNTTGLGGYLECL